jgi:hypothetical protein
VRRQIEPEVEGPRVLAKGRSLERVGLERGPGRAGRPVWVPVALGVRTDERRPIVIIRGVVRVVHGLGLGCSQGGGGGSGGGGGLGRI